MKIFEEKNVWATYEKKKKRKKRKTNLERD